MNTIRHDEMAGTMVAEQAPTPGGHAMSDGHSTVESPPATAGGHTATHGQRAAGDGRQRLRGIGSVATQTGVSERTLRYYEELGLLRPTAHRPGGSRLYSEADVERVRRIRELQSLMGFNLEEIRGIVAAGDRLEALKDEYRDTADSEHQRELLEEATRTLEDLRAQVMTKQEHLQRFLAQLDERLERNRNRLAAWAHDRHA